MTPVTLLKTLPDLALTPDLEAVLSNVNESHFTLFHEGKHAELFDSILYKNARSVITTDNPIILDDLLLANNIAQNNEKLSPAGFLNLSKSLTLPLLSHKKHLEIPFTKALEKEAILNQVTEWLQEFENKGTLLSKVKLVCDELFTNAFYNATVASLFDGKVVDRKEGRGISYPPGLEGKLNIALCDKFLFIECIDPFGTLRPISIVRSLRTSLSTSREDMMNTQEGGAGIGLRMIYDAALSLYLLVEPGKMTSVTALIPFGVSNKKIEGYTKNIHIHYGKETHMAKFLCSETKSDNKSILKLEGTINEDAILGNIKIAPASQVILDFQKVDGINSCGIREWIKWLATVPADSKISWINCPQEVVDQINMVAGFLPKNATVESFYIPYFCEECENGTKILITRKAGSKEKPAYEDEIQCAHCPEKAEIDIIESKYFKFLEK